MGNKTQMTIWKRTNTGIFLCAIAVAALVLAELFVGSDIAAHQFVGGFAAIFAYVVSFPMLALGALMIAIGAIAYLRDKLRRRSDA